MPARDIAELAVSLAKGLPSLLPPPLLLLLAAALLCNTTLASATQLHSSLSLKANVARSSSDGNVILKRVQRDLVHNPSDLGYYAPCTDTSTLTRTVTVATDSSSVATSIQTITLLSTSRVSLVSTVTLTENVIETTVENSQGVFQLTENVTETHFLQIPSPLPSDTLEDYKTVTSTSFKWVKLTHIETHVVTSTEIEAEIESLTATITPNKEVLRETETSFFTVTRVGEPTTLVSTARESQTKLFVYKTSVPSMSVTYTETLLTPSFSVSWVVTNVTVTSYTASKSYETLTRTLWASSTSTVMEYQTKTTTETTVEYIETTTTSTSVIRDKLTITAPTTSTKFVTAPGTVATVTETVATSTYTKTVRKACHHR